MSLQVYLDNIERMTGLTPRQLIDLAREQGFDQPGVRTLDIVEWLRAEHGLGRGHAMTMTNVIRSAASIDARQASDGGNPGEAPERVWLDGKATRP